MDLEGAGEPFFTSPVSSTISTAALSWTCSMTYSRTSSRTASASRGPGTAGVACRAGRPPDPLGDRPAVLPRQVRRQAQHRPPGPQAGFVPGDPACDPARGHLERFPPTSGIYAVASGSQLQHVALGLRVSGAADVRGLVLAGVPTCRVCSLLERRCSMIMMQLRPSGRNRASVVQGKTSTSRWEMQVQGLPGALPRGPSSYGEGPLFEWSARSPTTAQLRSHGEATGTDPGSRRRPGPVSTTADPLTAPHQPA